MTVDDFRKEVQDKLSVAAHRGSVISGVPLSRQIVLRQCEDFLVELFRDEQRNAVPVSALRALLECFRAEAKGEAEHEYAHRTSQWQNIRTVEGRMKEQCADRLAALCDAAEKEK